ncbi:MAG TPA: hypothetical protein VEY30_08890, partial [Myxococcaceae bacterium]|nr:hypothetical protein [Myxococcaceae bacterium]
MPSKKPVSPPTPPSKKGGSAHLRLGSTLSTVSGPSTLAPPAPRPLPGAPGAQSLDIKQGGTEQLAEAFPANAAKAAEH